MAGKPMTRRELDGSVCDTPGCTENHKLFIHAVCHPDVAPWAAYENGVLIFTCACGKPVARIAVAA